MLTEPQSTERSPEWCLSHCSPAAQQYQAHVTCPKTTQVAALTMSIKATTHAESSHCSLVRKIKSSLSIKKIQQDRVSEQHHI